VERAISDRQQATSDKQVRLIMKINIIYGDRERQLLVSRALSTPLILAS
jgi:hypothetical protein